MSSWNGTAILNPEEKWLALTPAQQVSRSVVVHACTITLLLFVASNTVCPRRHQPVVSESITICLQRPDDVAQHTSLIASEHTSPQIAPTITTAEVSNPLESGAESLPRPLPESSPNHLYAQGQAKPPLLANPSPMFGPSVPAPHTTPTTKPEISKNPTGLSKSIPVAATSPKPAPLAGPSPTPIAMLSPAGAGSTKVGSTHSEAPDVVTPGAATKGQEDPGNTKIDVEAVLKKIMSDDSDAVPDLTSMPFVGKESPLSILPEAMDTFKALDAKACSCFMQGLQVEDKNRKEARGLWVKAIKIMQVAIPVLQRDYGDSHPEMAFALRNVGRCYDELEDYEKSAEFFRRSIVLYAITAGHNSIERGISLVYYADALIHLKKYEEAEKILVESLPIYKREYGENSQYVGWTYRRLSNICYNTNRQQDGAEWQKKAGQLLQ